MGLGRGAAHAQPQNLHKMGLCFQQPLPPWGSATQFGPDNCVFPTTSLPTPSSCFSCWLIGGLKLVGPKHPQLLKGLQSEIHQERPRLRVRPC